MELIIAITKFCLFVQRPKDINSAEVTRSCQATSFKLHNESQKNSD